MAHWWFELVVRIPRIPLWKGLLRRGISGIPNHQAKPIADSPRDEMNITPSGCMTGRVWKLGVILDSVSQDGWMEFTYINHDPSRDFIVSWCCVFNVFLFPHLLPQIYIYIYQCECTLYEYMSQCINSFFLFFDRTVSAVFTASGIHVVWKDVSRGILRNVLSLY